MLFKGRITVQSSHKWHIGTFVSTPIGYIHDSKLQPWLVVTRIRLHAVETLDAPPQATIVNGEILNTTNQKQGRGQASTSDRETLDPIPNFCVSAAISGLKI